MHGQVVRTLVQGEQAGGGHAVRWDGMDQNGEAVSSGVYLYRFYGGEQLIEAKKMVLLQ
jgi:flagellar hook assembly protein FlgD